MTRTPRAVARDVHDIASLIAGFEVIAVWGDTLYRHYALNMKEAQEWADQYSDVPARVRIWAGSRQVPA
jgi:hypothetical protein